ncbi:MAG: hypothetical protein ACLTOG_01805 [Mediterraneibacter faecis]
MVTAYLDLAENRDSTAYSTDDAGLGKASGSTPDGGCLSMVFYRMQAKSSAEIAKAHAETEFEKYRVIQDRLFMSDFDKYMLELEENAKK